MADRKIAYFQMRLLEGDEQLLEELTQDYQLDRSQLVRRALEYLRDNRPVLQIVPQGKEAVPVMEMA